MKIALVTGAGRGIGLKLTEVLLEQNYVVYATTRDGKSTEGLKALGGDHQHLHIVKLDLLVEGSIEALPQQLNAVTHIDLLINNAGVALDASKDIKSITSEILLKTAQVNTVGPLMVVRVLLEKIEKAQSPIVASISSLMGSITDNSSGGYYGYRMSKAALNMVNKSFSVDFPKITFLVLHPGWVQTDMGGPNATIGVEESAEGLWHVIKKANKKDSGKFYDYKGKELYW